MTPERLKKIEDFKYTPQGEAAQWFIDELTSEIRRSWSEIKWLRERIDALVNRTVFECNHPDHRQENPAEDTGEHPPAVG